MKVLSSKVASLVLIFTIFSAGSVTGAVTVSKVFVTNFPSNQNVTVTNFPPPELDYLTLNITLNKPIVVSPSSSPPTLLGEAVVEGWNHVDIYVYWSNTSYWATAIVFNEFTFRTSASTTLFTEHSGYSGSFETTQTYHMQGPVEGPILDVWAYVSSYSSPSPPPPSLVSNVTVSLYLTK